MNRKSIKFKLLFGPVIMLILVMVISLIAVVTVLKKQNKNTSYDQIKKSIKMVQEELRINNLKLLEAAQQVAKINELGASIKFIEENNRNVSVVDSACKDITNVLSQVAVAGNFSKLAIYNTKGELLSFTAQKNDVTYLIGYGSDISSPASFRLSEYKKGQEIQAIQQATQWNEVKSFTDLNMAIKLPKGVPTTEKTTVEVTENGVWLAAYVPIIANCINKEKSEVER